MKLWGDDVKLDGRIEEFTVGEDPVLDNGLIPYDCRATIAHARMLGTIGILTPGEVKKIVSALANLVKKWDAGEFSVRRDQEDCHTAIEEYLTDKLGDVGKKIHTGRSRNDQVLVALRLYARDALESIDEEIQALLDAIHRFAKRHSKVEMPGFTHTRKAMPSSVGMWAGALADALADDRALLHAVMRICDQNPLGSGAGYGVPLPLNREMTTNELGFSKVQENPIYCQHSRGKFEAMVLHVLVQVLFDLNRAASDLILFSMPEFGFFKLPEELCTGSSIMPQKKNPDVLELLRGRFHEMLSIEQRMLSIGANLIHGYHRDMQLTKEPFMRGIAVAYDCLYVARKVFEELEVDKKRCKAAMSSELHAAEEAYKLVAQGVPFRDAYLQVKKSLKKKGS